VAATLIDRIVAACRAGNEPGAIMRMRSGWAVMGAKQVLRGYCLLLPDPVVPHLNALSADARDQFMSDLGRLGDAVLASTSALRINYAIFGNLEPALHAHVHPRYADEPEAFRTGNPWSYDWSQAPAFEASAHGALRDTIRGQLVMRPPTIVHQTSAAHGALHHVDLTVGDLARSTAFYDRWLPAMGFERMEDAADGPIWRGRDVELGLQRGRVGVTSRPHDRYAVGLHHVAMRAPSRDAVIDLHRQLLAEDVVVLDAPMAYEAYAPGYFAAFFADPDGIKLEYVFTPD
jgi:catechol 2,3-dioxygenase-like lactoylglutathione lyase family enzyme/diadenosine tetraphosphate (Ap4A) HIT family hydrolase